MKMDQSTRMKEGEHTTIQNKETHRKRPNNKNEKHNFKKPHITADSMEEDAIMAANNSNGDYNVDEEKFAVDVMEADMMELHYNKNKCLENQSNPKSVGKEEITEIIEEDTITDTIPHKTQLRHSPKKRLEFQNKSNGEHHDGNHKFIYGNYSQYYGYRNKGSPDTRLDIFNAHKSLFYKKDILDIGCNSGFITMEVAARFEPKSIFGIDIDRFLINYASKQLIKKKKALPSENNSRRNRSYPHNVTFVHANYVLENDCLLECEHAQFDVILCLSITKWIHLNFGDTGLKQAFRRMFLQLRDYGKLILEPQAFETYKKRKRMTENIHANYTAIKFFPKDFEKYLLSEEVGFLRMEKLGVPEHSEKGFKRPMYIFEK